MSRKFYGFCATAAVAALAAFASTPVNAKNVNTINDAATITIGNNGDFNANYAVDNPGTANPRTITFNIVNNFKPISDFDIELAETGTVQHGINFDITSTSPSGTTGNNGTNQTFHITNFSPPLTNNLLTLGTFAGLLKVTGIDGQNNGNDFNLKFSGTAVPLPAAGLLFGTALLGLGWFGRRGIGMPSLAT